MKAENIVLIVLVAVATFTMTLDFMYWRPL
jgi:hypothetical protein